MLKAAVAFVAIALVFVVAVPSAQAVGVYNRRLANALLGDCVRAPSGMFPSIDDAQMTSACGVREARWWVHVKSDSYRGTGHEVWQIESAVHPGNCLNTTQANNALLKLGTCQYSGSYHNKFEVFKSTWDGNNVYQLKDIEAFENFGRHNCLVQNYYSLYPIMSTCNLADSQYSSYWDAISW
jgi:hypothetical protein